MLALVGEGQEIHSGEEAGVVQWADALSRSGRPWRVVGPARLRGLFEGRYYEADRQLDLDTSLRAQAAGEVHRWVGGLLDGRDPEMLDALARRLRKDGFPIYVTRDLDAAKGYARDRFAHEPARRYGLLASSKAKNLTRYGLHSDFQATKRVHVGRWFNDDPSSRTSCCRLEDVVTEFQCQGLELDLPIVAWGDDFTWSEGRWSMASARPARLVRDPMRLRTNAYRVLLSRGREGLVIFVPPAPSEKMDGTFQRLVACGAVHVHGAVEAVRVA